MRFSSNRAESAPSTAPLLVDCTMFWSPAGGGVRRYLMAKHYWLKRYSGWRHTIVAPGADAIGFVDSGPSALPLPGGYCLPWRRRLAASIIEKLGPDLIEAGDPYRLAWAALDAAQRLSVPVVAFCHSNPVVLAAAQARSRGLSGRWAARRVAAYLARTYRHFDLVLAPSRAMTAELTALGIGNVQRQPLGVDTRVFHPGRQDSRWRRTLGLPGGSRVLLYAGRLSPEKNLPLLVDAVHRLGPRYVLLLLGSGSYVPPASPQVRVLPPEARPSALARVLASVDAFVHAGDQESFGLTVLEAMACGTPVIVRAAAGLAELIENGAGIGVQSARVDEWAEAITANFSSPGDRERQRQIARARAEAYDWRRILPGLMRRYQQLLDDQGEAAKAVSVVPTAT